jgi:hypothetical protein
MPAIRYALALLLAVVAAHLAWSAAVAGLLGALNDHRVANMSKIANLGTRWEDLASSFVTRTLAKARAQGRPVMMFLGSSVTWGHPWQESVIFTRVAAERLDGWKLANLSIVGAGMRGLTDFATCAINAQHRPHVLVVEIPLVNATSSVLSDSRHAPRVCAATGQAAGGYGRLVFERAWGIGWMSLFATEPFVPRPDEGLQTGKIPAGYFADRQAFAVMEPVFTQELRRFIGAVSVMADRVYVYVSPIHVPGIAPAGGDHEAVAAQIDLALRTCQEFAHVTCLDTRPLGERQDHFYNLTHLNQQGHRALAGWFIKQLAQQGPALGATR